MSIHSSDNPCVFCITGLLHNPGQHEAEIRRWKAELTCDCDVKNGRRIYCDDHFIASLKTRRNDM